MVTRTEGQWWRFHKPTRLALRVCLPFAIAVAGCGQGDGDGGASPSEGPKLAYVVTECSDTREGYVARQELRIQQGDGSHVTVAEFATPGVMPLPGVCDNLYSWGLNSVFSHVFQRLAMSPDGSVLVFEVTDDFSLRAPNQLVPRDEEGIFVVRTDGSGLRRLGDASRDPSFRFDPDTRKSSILPSFGIRADGSTIAFTDIGPGPGGDAVQVFTMDLATGTRRQVTRLPPAVGVRLDRRPVSFPKFLDDDTITFNSFANPVIGGEESNPAGERRIFSVKTYDPDTLRIVPIYAEPGSDLIEEFQITGTEPVARILTVRGKPVNGPHWLGDVILEVFLLDGGRVLQLTNFKRSDLLGWGVGAGRERLLFFVAADPFGTNPCLRRQIFSIDRLGGDLRQVTNFQPPGGVCLPRARPEFPLSESTGCRIMVLSGQDPATRWIVFSSSCDLFGSNPGDNPWVVNVFAVRPDGTGLRQLTQTRGIVGAPDGTVTKQLVGPWASPRLGG